MTEDYCVRGNVGIAGTWDLIPVINNLLRVYDWHSVIKVREILSDNDKRFADNYKDPKSLKPVYSLLTKDRIFEDNENNQYWTKHSIQGTPGTSLDMLIKRSHEKDFEVIKSGSPDEVTYSAFGTEKNPTTLSNHLEEQKIENLVFVGSNFDYGVGLSAIDSIDKSNVKKTFILEEGTKFIFKERKEQIRKQFLEKDGLIISSSDLVHLTETNN